MIMLDLLDPKISKGRVAIRRLRSGLHLFDVALKEDDSVFTPFGGEYLAGEHVLGPVLGKVGRVTSQA